MTNVKIILLYTGLLLTASYALVPAQEQVRIKSIEIGSDLGEKTLSYAYFVTVFFESFPMKSKALNVSNYELMKVKEPEKLLRPFDIDNYDEEVQSVNLYFKLEKGKEYRLRLTNDFTETVYIGRVIGADSAKTMSESGIIKTNDGSTGVPVFDFDVRTLDGLNKIYAFDFHISDSWNDYLPYRFDGVVTTKPDSVSNNLTFEQQFRINLSTANYIPLLVDAKVQTDQQFNSADVTFGLGIASFLPYSRKLPFLSLLSNRLNPIRDARVFLGIEAGGNFQKGEKTDGVLRANGEIAWRIPVLNTSSYIVVKGKGWLLDLQDNPVFKGYIDLKFEYAISEKFGVITKYVRGSLPPEFKDNENVSFGFTISAENKKTGQKLKIP